VKFVVSRKFGGVRFIIYKNDHPPRHAHGFSGDCEAIIDLRSDGNVTLAKRVDAVRCKRETLGHRQDPPGLRPQISTSLLCYGRAFMKHGIEGATTRRRKVTTTNAEIDRALERAQRLRNEPLVRAVEYKPGPGLDLIILKLSDGRRHLIPRELLQGLESATSKQIAHVEIVGGGTGLHWPDLDADLYVPALLRGVYGNRRWMAKIGRNGGLAKSPAKKRAARANGLKGGRPRLEAIGGD
jgi:hypothetical protein